MDKNEKKLRERIFEFIKELYLLRKAKEDFVPGKTAVHYSGRVYDEKEIISLVDCALDFWLTLGRYGQRFCEDLSDFLKVKYVSLVNSGSSANLLAVSALTSPALKEKRLKPGDEVITVAASFPTTINPIIQNRLVPVFLDVDLGTYNIDVSQIKKALGKKTKAIFLAHTLGNPFDIDAVTYFTKKYGLFLIEDACDALGSIYNGRQVGTFGDMATLSFYPAHHITMGEGGAVITNNLHYKKVVESLRDWGRDCWCKAGEDDTCRKRFKWQLGKLPYGYDHKYVYSHIGYNLKPVDMQPAIGVEQLKKLPLFIQKRRNNFSLLYAGLKRYQRYFILPSATPGSKPSWFGFILTVKKGSPFSREQIVSFLEHHKIATRPLFAGNILKHPAYEGIRHRVFGGLTNTDYIMNNTFWIGVYPGLDEEKINYMLGVFHLFMKKYKERSI